MDTGVSADSHVRWSSTGRRSRLSAGRWIAAIWLCVGVAFDAGATGKSLTPFGSKAELRDYLETLSASRRRSGGGGGSEVEQVVVTGSFVPSITNTQTDGVDEGGIVKVHGDHLVILRRGRLFTVSIRTRIEPVAWTNAFGAGSDGDAWYDEMLIHRDRVIVIGYSYERGGTEIGLFTIDAAGRLLHDATYHLRSNDYYSSRNYASRLVDDKLIFYTPLNLDGEESLPAMRRWPDFASRWERSQRDDSKGFASIIDPADVFRPALPLEPGEAAVLHTITTCDLAAKEFSCEARGVIGTYSNAFYVSKSAVYLWTGEATPMAYRMPLDGALPTAIRTYGTPIDQFSFLEDADSLNVVVRSDSRGSAMWAAESSQGAVALFRVPLSGFADGSAPVQPEHYRLLPQPSDGAFLNRFIGTQLLYGIGDSWGPSEGSERSTLFVVDVRGGDIDRIELPHSVDRIEPMQTNAVVIGTDESERLHFTGLRLGRWPSSVQHYSMPKASQGELRSHGFFYLPHPDRTGTFGLPVRGGGESGWKHLVEDSIAVLFLENTGHDFKELGLLAGTVADEEPDDNCVASCVDWYGNSRPIFLRDRVFALVGYELIEGTFRNGRIKAARRIDFTPFVR